jgi:threonine synthase
VVAQVVYYFRGYLKATTDNDQKVSFTVPSGNFGNICAGHIARMMGLPIDKLVVAPPTRTTCSTSSSAPASTACASRPRPIHTSSPSMDISKASNFERFVYDLVGRDSERTHALFRKVETHGGFDLSGAPGSDGDEFKRWRSTASSPASSTHEDRLETIRDVATTTASPSTPTPPTASRSRAST